jgi:hypothetical protein
VLGANGDAVLGVAADLQAPFAHQGVEPLAGVVRPGRVAVEEHHLADRVGAEEVAVVLLVLAGFVGVVRLPFQPFDFDLQVLRAGVEAAAAAHAFGERIALFLDLGRDARAGADVVVAIDRNPGLVLGQRAKEAGPIDAQVADDRKLGHRGQLDLAGAILEQAIDQGRARLANLAVDQHRARAADLFQAVAIPGDGGDRLAVGGRGLGRDPLQHADHVHLRLVLDAMPLPIARLTGAVLAEDTNLERARAVGGVSVVRMTVGHESISDLGFRICS